MLVVYVLQLKDADFLCALQRYADPSCCLVLCLLCGTDQNVVFSYILEQSEHKSKGGNILCLANNLKTYISQL